MAYKEYVGEGLEDIVPHVEDDLRMYKNIPMSVAQVVAHWNEQVAANPLWSEAEREVITQTVQAIEGKRKRDALSVLQAQQNGHDGRSNEASFARMFSRELRQGM